MITRIVLENYMAHERTVIEPAAGLTVLAGPNNCGKSAVISALQTLCGDHAGDFMVRHGHRTASVTVETDDGHSIAWRRKGAAVSYVIDGREIARAGRGNLPDDLHTLLRLPKVQPAQSDDGFDVHFGLQKSPIFLIDSESKPAAFFSTSGDAERLLDVQRKHREKKSNARSAERNLVGEIERFEAQLKTLAPLDPLAEALEAAEAEHQALFAQAGEIAGLELIIEKIAQAADSRDRCAAIAGALAPLEPAPKLEETQALESQIARYDETLVRRTRCSATRAALSPLSPPPALADPDPLESHIRGVVRMTEAQARARAELTAVQSLHDPPELDDESALVELGKRLRRAHRLHDHAAGQLRALAALAEAPGSLDPGPLMQEIRAIQQAQGAVARARRRVVALRSLADPPAPLDPAPLEQFLRTYGLAIKRSAALGTEVHHLSDALREVEEAVVAWAAENPACPTCGSVIDDPRKLLAGGHAHA